MQQSKMVVVTPALREMRVRTAAAAPMVVRRATQATAMAVTAAEQQR
jgi:hypothetical protein